MCFSWPGLPRPGRCRRIRPLRWGDDIDYVVVRTFNQYTFSPEHVVLAKDLVPAVLSGKYFMTESADDLQAYKPEDKKIPYMVCGQMKGSRLVGARYEQLMPLALPYMDADKAFRVISGDYVTTSDGTGIMHIAPTFGADDARGQSCWHTGYAGAGQGRKSGAAG